MKTRLAQEEAQEEAAVDRATRAYELEAAKTRLLDERDLREFARGVFRREYRADRLEKLRKQMGVGIDRRRPAEWDRNRRGSSWRDRARSFSPGPVGMGIGMEEYGLYSGERHRSKHNNEAVQTENEETPKPKRRQKKPKTHSHRSPPGNRHDDEATVRVPKCTSAVIGDTISIPHATQRKLIKQMYTICLTSAFNFSKQYRLPLTLNQPAPSPHTTRLTIHTLTDAIIAAYNTGAIPPESVWEDIAFGFVGVFEAAAVLDDAVLYFKMRLGDRRMRAVLLAGVDLLMALRDDEAVLKGEAVLREVEELIDEAREAREAGTDEGEEDEETEDDGDEEMGEGDDDDEDGDEDEKDEKVDVDVNAEIGVTAGKEKGVCGGDADEHGKSDTVSQITTVQGDVKMS